MSPPGHRLRFAFALGVSVLLLDSAAASAASAHLAYYGGSVVSNPGVVAVAWGPNVDATVQNGMAGFYNSILGSPYLDWLSEYSTVGLLGLDSQPGSNQRIGRGTFVGSYTITPSAAASGNVLSSTQVLTELAAQIAAGHLPGPQLDATGNANTLYMVNFPPGVTLLSYGGAQSCGASASGFCGTTDTLVVGSHNVGVGLILDESPDAGCVCGTDGFYFNNVTEVHAHQLLNLVTDVDFGVWAQGGSATVARPLAWYSLGQGGHQAADLCAGMPANVGGYTVEMGWSNTQGACVAGPASPLPLCTASGTYCRQCSATDVGQDGGCTGSTASCETDATNVSFGQCVACTAGGASCSGTTPVCARGGTSNDTCRACSGDAECTDNAAGSHCLSSGACGPAPAPAAKSGGCSTSGSPTPALAALLAVLALWRRPSRAQTRRARHRDVQALPRRRRR